MAEILSLLVLNEDLMTANLDATKGLIYSQPVLLALVDAGMDRHEAYRVVQEHAHCALNGGPSLFDALSSDPVVTERVGTDTLARLFDPRRQLDQVGAVFSRLGLSEALETDGEERLSEEVPTRHIPRAHQTNRHIDAPSPQT